LCYTFKDGFCLPTCFFGGKKPSATKIGLSKENGGFDSGTRPEFLTGLYLKTFRWVKM